MYVDKIRFSLFDMLLAFKGTLMQIWKFIDMLFFIWK